MTHTTPATPATAGTTGTRSRPARRAGITAALARLTRRPVILAAAVVLTGLAAVSGWSQPVGHGVAGHAVGAAVAVIDVIVIAAIIVMVARRVRAARQARQARPAAYLAEEAVLLPPPPPVPPFPLADPSDPAEAIRICDRILAGLRPGPEQVTAADPGSTPVRWDVRDWHDRAGRARNLPGHRADKMKHIRQLVRREAIGEDLLHRLPQLLLTAEDGAVAELFGDRTGVLAGEPGLHAVGGTR